jgi:SAM-dependent methyltransferase
MPEMDPYSGFAAIYDDWSASMTEDVAFYVDLAREADGPVVELAVGTGRVAVPVAATIARSVVGVDRSPAMLALARARAEAAGAELDLREADMRDFALDEPAALVYCPFRSLLHLPTWADRRQVFERVAASLQPGGRFAWNAFVFDPTIAAERDGEWHVQGGVRHRTDYAPSDNRVTVTLEDGAAIVLWWLARSEWDGLIEVAGLEVEALYGWFDRRPFDEGSSEFVYVVRRPG